MLSRLSTRLTRLPSLISSVEVTQHPQAGTCLSMNLSNDGHCTNVTVPLVWFRDHCRSPKVYNHKSELRKFKQLNILEESRISGSNSVTFDGEQLSINWEDGHKSKFDVTLLMKMLVKPLQKQPRELHNLWSRCHISAPPRQHVSTFSFSEFSQQFVQFGVVAFEGVDPTIEGTEKFALGIAPFHDTFYGPIWTISNYSEQQEGYHTGTEYSNEELGPHTDGSYAMQSPGVVSFLPPNGHFYLFHCLRPADEGGVTMLVDAFAAAERLKGENPSAFRMLTTTPIDHHYNVKGNNPLCLWAPGRPVIEMDPYGGYKQIRFHSCHRATLRLSLNGGSGLSKPEDILAYYEAYQAFQRICYDPAMAVTIRLTRGTALVIDNFRVLHARTEFKGYRQMCGAYLSRDNLMAKARLHLEEDIRFQI